MTATTATTIQTQREAVTELLVDLRGYYTRALAGPRRTDFKLQRQLDLLNDVLLGYGIEIGDRS